MMLDYFLPAIFLLAFSGCAAPSKKENKPPATDTSVFEITQSHQVLLTHEAHFKKHTSLYGASAFLLHYRGGIYAVTARHLIGSAGGVEPEIKPANLNRYFEKWRLFPRVPVHPATDTVVIAKTTLNYDSLAHDILLLPTTPSGASTVALEPQFSLPEKGEPLFIIGCPYSESDCRQNVYPVTYVNFDTRYLKVVGHFI